MYWNYYFYKIILFGYGRCRMLHKILALILSLWMLLSLCACGSASQDQLEELLVRVQTAQETLNAYIDQATRPDHVDTAEDFCWNGQTSVWFLLPGDMSPDMLLVSSAMASMCQANGWTYERKELGPETGTALSLLKAAIASDEVGAIVYTRLTDYLADFVQQAADAGIVILCLDPDTTAPVAGSIEVPYAQMGAQTVAMLHRWCEETGYAPEEDRLPVAVNLYGESGLSAPWASAVLTALEESELFFTCRTGLTYEGDDLFNAAYIWARTTLAGRPDIRLFCCREPQAAYGVCYYLEQYAADHELDLADFCVVWCGEDEESQTYLSVARENDSYTAARGYTLWGDDPWTTGSRMAYELLGIAHGAELPATLEETYSYVAENGVEIPEEFGGWLWGRSGFSDVLVYTSFAESEDGLPKRVSTPMTDIVNLLPQEEEEEAE